MGGNAHSDEKTASETTAETAATKTETNTGSDGIVKPEDTAPEAQPAAEAAC